MPAVVLAAVVAVVAPVGYLAHAGVLRSGRSLAIARRNLTRGLATTTVEVGSLESRRTGASSFLRVITPDAVAKRVRHLLEVAGHPAGLTMVRVLWVKVALAATATVLGLAVLAGGAGLLTWMVVLSLVGGSYFVPDAVVWSRGEERQKTIARELPDALDQMTIAVTAGLGFEAALSHVAANGKGPLAEEFSRTLHDVSAGRPRREAYTALVSRTNVVELKRFVGAINQADTYGIAIADVLRVQAEEMRVKRRQRAKEQAMKVPVKVTFPLMACFLPALLIVVVGPAIMGLIGVLG
jgi:tight adherence protein C